MILSLGVSMTIKGQKLGVGPWDVLHVGLYKNYGLTIGTWGIITGFIIIILTAAVLKEWPKIGYVAEHDSDWSLYRFIQLAASGYTYDGWTNTYFFSRCNCYGLRRWYLYFAQYRCRSAR